MGPPENHLTTEQIALIIEGKVDARDWAGFLDHIRGCRECSDALQDAAVYYEVPAPDLEDSEGALALAEAGRDLLGKDRAASTFPDRKSVGFLHRRIVRYAAFATAAGMILVIGMMMGNLMQRQSDSIVDNDRSPIQVAIEIKSSSGQIILPGGEDGLQGSDPVYRSGQIPLKGKLKESVDALYEEYRGSTASSEVTYWLLSAYLATDQIEIARDIAADARKRFPEDDRIKSLYAIIALMDEDYPRSESVFRDVLESNADDSATRLNLALVLIEQNKLAEARALLSRVIEEESGTPLALRAESILTSL